MEINKDNVEAEARRILNEPLTLFTRAHMQAIIAQFLSDRSSATKLQGIGVADQYGLYAGIIRGNNGDPDSHLYLVKVSQGRLNLHQAVDWAKEQDGVLCNRRELRLLTVNLGKHLPPNSRIWSRSMPARPGFGWVINTTNGQEGIFPRNNLLYAIAIRRYPVE